MTKKQLKEKVGRKIQHINHLIKEMVGESNLDDTRNFFFGKLAAYEEILHELNK